MSMNARGDPSVVSLGGPAPVANGPGVGARGGSHARAGTGGGGRKVLDVDVLIEELLSVSPGAGGPLSLLLL